MPTFRRLLRALAPAMLLAGAGGAFFAVPRRSRPGRSSRLKSGRGAARLPDGGAGVRIPTQGGAIRLSGMVDSLLRKAMAAKAAASVPGVVRIVDALQVSPEKRTGLAVVRDFRWALAHDPVTLGLDLTASVRQGLVRLEGVAATTSRKRIAVWILSDIRGVRGIDNRIRVSAPPRPDAEIRGGLSRRYAASPLFDDGRVVAAVRDGVVTLTGTVRSAIGKTWAEEDAWLPGVREVDAGGLAGAREVIDELGAASAR